jgi:hypothetical protein
MPDLPENTLRFIASHGLHAVRIENHPIHEGSGWMLMGNRNSMFYSALIDENTKFPETKADHELDAPSGNP